MQVLREALEILAAVIPAVLTVVLAAVRARNIHWWFIKVLGTAVLSVIALGTLLIRLTSVCESIQPECTLPDIPLERAPGLIGSCYCCTTPGVRFWVQLLNRSAMDIHAASAAVCVLGSSFTIIRFMLWAKRSLRSNQ